MHILKNHDLQVLAHGAVERYWTHPISEKKPGKYEF